MSRVLREEVARSAATALRFPEYKDLPTSAFDVADTILPIIAREVEAALAAARPVIERETVERCAKVAAEYGPSRPLASGTIGNLIYGRWEGEQAASANIAAAIRGEPT